MDLIEDVLVSIVGIIPDVGDPFFKIQVLKVLAAVVFKARSTIIAAAGSCPVRHAPALAFQLFGLTTLRRSLHTFLFIICWIFCTFVENF